MKRVLSLMMVVLVFFVSVSILYCSFVSDAPAEKPFIGDQCYYPEKPVIIDAHCNALYVYEDQGFVYKAYKLGLAERLDRIINWGWKLNNPYGCLETQISFVSNMRQQNDIFIIYGQSDTVYKYSGYKLENGNVKRLSSDSARSGANISKVFKEYQDRLTYECHK